MLPDLLPLINRQLNIYFNGYKGVKIFGLSIRKACLQLFAKRKFNE